MFEVFMNQNENKNEFSAYSGEMCGVPQKPKKQPVTVSVPMTIVLVLLAALITFQTTYVVLTVKHTLELTKTKSTVGNFKVLMEALGYYDENYLYEIDDDTLIDHMLSAFSGQDKYSTYYTAEEFAEMIASGNGNAKGIGVYVTGTTTSITVTHVMKGSPAQTAGLLKNDQILAVDGAYVSQIGYTEAVNRIIGEDGTSVVLTIMRDGKEVNVTIVRGSYTPETVIYSEITENGEKIGYIRIIQFDAITVSQFKTAMEELKGNGCKKFIFDLRDNPGGNLDAIVKILDYLLPEGPIVHILDKDMNVLETHSSDKNEVNAEMVVLTNGNTASAAELFTSALRDYEKATLVGTKTYGKGCGQTPYMLSNGGVLYITAFFYNPPFGDNFDGEGVEPNIEKELPEEYRNTNIFMLPQEYDTQLEAALAAITNK
jgi:carboxyl-terminal processing protease